MSADAHDRWQKSAERQNARLTARAPLLAHAGLVPVATAEGQQAKVEHAIGDFERRSAALAAEHEAQGALFKERVAALVTAKELAELERRRAWCPKSPAYSADFWGGKLKKLDPVRWRAMQDPAWIATWDAVYAAEAARLAPAPLVEQLDLPSGMRVAPQPVRVATQLRIGGADHADEETEAVETAAEETLVRRAPWP